MGDYGNNESFVDKSWFVINCAWFILHIRPLKWQIGWKDLIHDLGDNAYHHAWVLCFYLEFVTETEKGKRGREYRRKLKESGDWDPSRQPDGELRINKEALLNDA